MTGTNWKRPAIGLLAIALAILATSGATSVNADEINMDQLQRLLNGETIVERGGMMEEEDEYTDDFDIHECRFHSTGFNKYFRLRPGYQLYLAGVDEEEGDELVELYITVLRQTRRIRFDAEGRRLIVRARIVEEREYKGGELFEISRNYYAECKFTKDVFYFGEEVDFYEDGEIVGHDGAWLSGENDAVPGIIMPGRALLGSRYFQEVAPGIALDRAEHVEEGLEVFTPAGLFEGCIAVLETTELDPDSESEKVYAPHVGLIQDDFLELVDYGYQDLRPPLD